MPCKGYTNLCLFFFISQAGKSPFLRANHIRIWAFQGHCHFYRLFHHHTDSPTPSNVYDRKVETSHLHILHPRSMLPTISSVTLYNIVYPTSTWREDYVRHPDTKWSLVPTTLNSSSRPRFFTNSISNLHFHVIFSPLSLCCWSTCSWLCILDLCWNWLWIPSCLVFAIGIAGFHFIIWHPCFTFLHTWVPTCPFEHTWVPPNTSISLANYYSVP